MGAMAVRHYALIIANGACWLCVQSDTAKVISRSLRRLQFMARQSDAQPRRGYDTGSSWLSRGWVTGGHRQERLK